MWDRHTPPTKKFMTKKIQLLWRIASLVRTVFDILTCFICVTAHHVLEKHKYGNICLILHMTWDMVRSFCISFSIFFVFMIIKFFKKKEKHISHKIINCGFDTLITIKGYMRLMKKILINRLMLHLVPSQICHITSLIPFYLVCIV